LDLLADQLGSAAGAARQSGDSAEVFDADAWYLERARLVLLLNKDRPQAIEERTLVSTTEGLRRIGVAVALPRHPREARDDLGIETEMLYGADIERRAHPSDSMFVQYLRLPRPLSHGERHTYARSIHIPRDQIMVPRYVHLPVHRCDQLEIRVKFDPMAMPRAVWRIDKVPEMVYASGRPGNDRLELDSLGEVHVEFSDLQLGVGYGVGWLPSNDGGD
jgi:hypothetical protein